MGQDNVVPEGGVLSSVTIEGTDQVEIVVMTSIVIVMSYDRS